MRKALDAGHIDVDGWVSDILEYRIHWLDIPRVPACLRIVECRTAPRGERVAALYAIARLVERTS